jgi:hypothetical protein
MRLRWPGRSIGVCELAHVPAQAAFATVQIDSAIYAFKIATEQ